MLSLLHHTNLVNMVGYCCDGDQRILVYEYMANGSLEDHLLGKPEKTRYMCLTMFLKIILTKTDLKLFLKIKFCFTAPIQKTILLTLFHCTHQSKM